MPVTDDIAQIARLQTEVKSLTEAVRALTASMQKNNERLERLAVLEALHTSSNDAISRAFAEIKKIELESEEMADQNERSHKSYDRAIWSAVGFTMAVSIFWSVFGIKAQTALDEMQKSNMQMQMHIQVDRVLTESDVVKLHKSEIGNGK